MSATALILRGFGEKIVKTIFRSSAQRLQAPSEMRVTV